MNALAGRHALVTGGGTGIGAAIAIGLAQRGRGGHDMRPAAAALAGDRSRRGEHSDAGKR